MKKISLIILALSLILNALAQDNTTKNICEQIFSFSNNVSFPNQQKINTYKIAIFGKNSSIYDNLVKNYKNTKIHGKPVEFNNLTKTSELNIIYNILFVDYSKNKSIPEIFSKIQKKGTLLITYKATDAKYMMINLSDNSKDVQVQTNNLIDQNIIPNEKLVATGGSKYDLQDLYQQKMDLLTKKELELQSEKQNLDSLSLIVNQQKSDNQTKEKLLNQKNQEINQKEGKLKLQENSLKMLAFKIKLQKNIILITIIFVLIFITLSVITYRALKKNRIITEQVRQRNEEIMQQKEQIEIQSVEIEKQRDLAINRGNELENKNKDIQDSIHYAYRIQQALLPDINFLKNTFFDFLVFYKPKDIVSGDFYWATTRNDKTIIIAADCTGHGVPGAMMSMLGVSFLNQIFENADINEPGYILDYLKELVIKSLKQDYSVDQSSKDGMDLSMTIFDKKTSIIQNAGANNSIYIISDTEPEIIEGFEQYRTLKGSDFSLFEITADKRPIGIYYNNDKNFTSKKVKVKKNDVIVMFSDGFGDLYNFKRQQKYTSKRFKEFLLANVNLPFEQFNSAIEQEYSRWLDGDKQIDDILILALKI